MKGKLLAFLILPFFLFLFLLGSPFGVKGVSEDWRDSSECVAQCGTTEGTKLQTLFVEVCDEGCPTKSFTAEHKIYAEDFIVYSPWSTWSSCSSSNKCNPQDENVGLCQDEKCNGNNYKKQTRSVINAHACPAGYTYKEQSGSADDCYKVETFGPIDVVYGLKSSDPNKCHRPTGVSLGIPSWAMSDFNTDPNLPEHIQDAVVINCRFEASSTTREVACSTDMIACEQDCPTECGYEGGLVADGDGGLKRCPATNSCSTYRWCYPDEESPTGYLAQAVSISIPTPAIGKPWESGKMIDQYCGYTPAGECPTTCGYAGGEIVPDGQGGTLTCPATAACPGDDDEEEEDDDGEIEGVTDEDEGEVKGTTDVVLAETGASDTTLVYFVQMILVLGTLVSSAIFVKKYML